MGIDVYRVLIVLVLNEKEKPGKAFTERSYDKNG
jgi:hypothetical protein